MLQTKIIEKIKTHIHFIFNVFSPKIVRDNVEELDRARQAAGDKNHA